MDRCVDGAATRERQVRVAAMAGVVRDLVAGGRAALPDAGWLRARAAAAGLNSQEGAALEELRARLEASGPSAAALLATSSHWS